VGDVWMMQKFVVNTNQRNLQPFYEQLREFGIEKEGTTINNNKTMSNFKTTVVELIDKFKDQIPVTQFTSSAQWYIAIDIGPDFPLAKRNLFESTDLTEFKLGEISPYTYKGHEGSPFLLYKAPESKGSNFGLVNPYLSRGEPLTLAPNRFVQELLLYAIDGMDSVNAYEPSSGLQQSEAYVNISTQQQLMIQNIALTGTEIDYDEEDSYIIRNPNIGIDDWMSIEQFDETFYLMYSIGESPFKRKSIALNYPKGSI
tara:strand:+ start:302 stop:1072 length:771 start_codon:yes stop_codon:yes gene_type:complete